MQQPWHENISFKKSQMQNKEQLVNVKRMHLQNFSVVSLSS